MPTSVTPTIRGGYQGEQPSGCLGPIGAATGFGGLLMGVSDSLTGGLLGLGGFIINPGQLVPSLQQAYNEAGGGWGGFYYAANQLNPMYGVLTSADACVSAMDAGSAYGAGKDCTTFLTDSAAAAGVVAAGGKLAGLATETGIGSDLAVAQGHLASIDAIDSYLPNKAMLERIADAQATGRALTAAEQNFLTHEVTEAQLMSQGMTLEEAHAAAMQTHPTFANYDPEVITAYPEYFNDNWRAYWGIK
jgi:hypothetical protein